MNDVFEAGRLAKFPGKTAVGHVRYSTAGGYVAGREQVERPLAAVGELPESYARVVRAIDLEARAALIFAMVVIYLARMNWVLFAWRAQTAVSKIDATASGFQKSYNFV